MIKVIDDGIGSTPHEYASIYELRDDITRLTRVWKELVSADRWKMRDLTFEITMKWTFGLAPCWVVKHVAFLQDDIEGCYDSERRALEAVISGLTDNIKKEREVHQLAERCLS